MSDKLTQNDYAEGAVLASMMLDRDCIPRVCEKLTDEVYFFKTEHRMIYSMLCSVHETSDSWDALVFRDVLRKRGQLAAVGGVEYIHKLAYTLPSASNVLDYVRMVQDAYLRRRMVECGEGLCKAAVEAELPIESINAIMGDMDELINENQDVLNQSGSESVRQKINSSPFRRVQPLPWSSTSRLSNALQPGMVTILCGSPGSSKSFASMQMLACFADHGVKAAYFALEFDEEFHLMRALAQRSDLSTLTDPDWVTSHQEDSESVRLEHQAWLDTMGGMIDADGGGMVAYDRLINWIIRRAKTGHKVLIIDPVTGVCHKTPQTWAEDSRFLHHAKRVCTDYGVSLVLVSHPTKSQGIPGMESLAGGAAFSRFCQTIFWLEAHEDKNSEVYSSSGRFEVQHNRTLHVLKATLGKGSGSRVAFTLDTDLKLKEHGVIIKKKKGKSDE